MSVAVSMNANVNAYALFACDALLSVHLHCTLPSIWNRKCSTMYEIWDSDHRQVTLVIHQGQQLLPQLQSQGSN